MRRNGPLALAYLLALVVVGLALTACPHRITRSADTVFKERFLVVAALEDAAADLRASAIVLRDLGRRDDCVMAATRALRLELQVRPHVIRALYLDGLPYPEGDAWPEAGTGQPDPGAPAPFDPTLAVALCDALPPEAL